MNRQLRSVLEAHAAGVLSPTTREYAKELLAETGTRRRWGPKKEIAAVDQAKDRKAAAADELRKAIATMREAVWSMNITLTAGPSSPNGRCDNQDCRRTFPSIHSGELDHWKGRRGPSAHHQDNGWRLCRECHSLKTANSPDAATWNRRRSAYCTVVGINFVPRKEFER